MVSPSLLAFGSQIDVLDPTYLSRIRSLLLLNPSTVPLVESIGELPQQWTSLVDSCQLLSIVPGEFLLEKLHRWVQDDRVLDFTAEVPPNTILTPLTVICQVVEYLTYLRVVLRQTHADVRKTVSPTKFKGLCVGMLTATALGCAKDEAELVAQAITAVRMAVLVGAAVDADGRYATPPIQLATMIARCGEGCDRLTVDSALERYSDVRRIS